ncbi:MAG: uroporphyrinogen decarboxylase [Gemmatimonadota bacterium]|nr:MAG: uroporphyrinogen decarboxylase [Gemmatimonadota bacterium]
MIALANDRFLRAARGQEVDATPIWMMRQAGRVLPEYRALRKDHSFLEVAHDPALCAEVTTQPVDRLNVDAAILFSDILLPAEAMGIGMRFDPGPKLDRQVGPGDGPATMRRPRPKEDWTYLHDCIQATLKRLDGRVPLIGFCGSPFTVACYLIDGGGSKNWVGTRRWMNTDPEGFREFLFFLGECLADWLQVQIDAGVHAVQVFDSWASLLSPAGMERFSLPAVNRILNQLKIPDDFPTIYFAPGAGTSLRAQSRVGARMIGLDWRVNLRTVRSVFQDLPLQGNLDPGLLLGSEAEIEAGVRSVLQDAQGGAHVFNLGHGVIPETPVENAELVVRLVHEISREGAQ